VLPWILSSLTVFISIPLLRKVALKFNILDVPDQRKAHKDSTPLLGGIAVYLGVVLGLILDIGSFRYLSGILIGGSIILLIGLLDDIYGLSAKIRLVGQLAACLAVIFSGYRIEILPNNIIGDMGEVLLTVIWIIGITNAVNYLDGIDGLAAGTTAISALTFASIGFLTGQYPIVMISVILMACCIGFLPHNLKREKIFLGDAGSTFLGFTLASIAVTGNWASDNVIKLTIPILILGVPIFDMTFTTIMRIKEKKISSFSEWLSYAGKDHFHHRLIDIGLNKKQAFLFIVFVTGSLGINSIIISNARNNFEGVLAIIQASIIFCAIGVLMVIGARRRSGWDISD
jgi:UDP-GlcNAc:undecaprenyl-phosphate GlcNAc-1-phosphate transferase